MRSCFGEWDINTVFTFFCPLRKALSTYFPRPRPSHHQFSNYIPSNSLTIQPSHWSQPMILYLIVHLAIFPSKQANYMVYCLKFCPLGDFPFTAVLWDATGRGGSAAAVYFWGVIWQPDTSLLFLWQLIIGNAPWCHWCSVEERRQQSRSGAVNIWATSSGNLLVISGLVQAWSCMYHFFWMMEYKPNFMAWWVR